VTQTWLFGVRSRQGLISSINVAKNHSQAITPANGWIVKEQGRIQTGVLNALDGASGGLFFPK
jgi:hypothetical protein